MRTEKIQTNVPQFGALRYSNSIDKKIIFAIECSPAGRKFAKMYDAKISKQIYSSRRHPEQSNLGLLIDDIKPSSVWRKFVDFLVVRKQDKNTRFINFNSGYPTEEGLIKSIKSLDKDAFVNMYREV